MKPTMMLWQENVPLAERIRNAAGRFEKKYGYKPTLALVNPKLLSDHRSEVDGIAVRAARYVAMNCVLIGIEQSAAELERATADMLREIAAAVEAL